jgi:hypothetical protein
MCHLQMALVKFGMREHLEQFRNCGLLYMNAQKYFREIEDETRRDRFETTDRIAQPNAFIRLTVESRSKRFVLSPVDTFLFSSDTPCNIYCMVRATQTATGLLVDARNCRLGDSCVVILNTQSFLDRVFSAAKSRGFNCQSGLVEYYDDRNYSGETGPFRKPAAHSWQNEFRFIVWPGSSKPIQLEVGCLEDISEIYPVSEFGQLDIG